INDWGGVSPLTPDHVNPEAPWPHLDQLAAETESADRFLELRLTIYPEYVRDAQHWVNKKVMPYVLSHSDSDGMAKRDTWHPGAKSNMPTLETILLNRTRTRHSNAIEKIVAKCLNQEIPELEEVSALFQARGDDFTHVTKQANALRRRINGETVSYIVNRNINYTNVCYFKCQFCAFSKGKLSENLRGRPYDISGEEIARRCREAWERGATEVCMQGGIHPDYSGTTYLEIVNTVKQATPHMHVHAFSPLEVWQGAETLGISLEGFLQMLQNVGLGTLPGTAAEVLHDEVRQLLCPDKLTTAQWLEVMETAHATGFNTTATIMFGHVDRPQHWAAHLLAIRKLQSNSGGFTEFVPLPYVHMEAPLYLKGKSRRGPSYREALLMHAVPRLVLYGAIDNIQTSWVKMGETGAHQALNAGANDLGGTLMNESITRAAGSEHGQEWHPAAMEARIRSWKRLPRMRTTLYQDAPIHQRQRAMMATDLNPLENLDASKHQRNKQLSGTVELAGVS
ncbi:MAG: 5-amino-6-(D-ribitylamino)uracil--L-tyrosine 4-hydroxyphenyl transferase CofH, partial [Gammaproteobacteria bacterium]|nr:5-amino-6-(D-ribitylamino)uracil--L-tyrosine 4-hydroxyphenyl transferase CofH [Gammaproteobacteria bacterium]